MTKKKASDPDMSLMLKNTWKSMSEEEQDKFTSARVEEMTEAREVRNVAKHNSAIAAFHDVQATLRRIENEVSHFLYP